MKNYNVVSHLCDEISYLVSSLKVDATNPTKPSYLRIQAQRRLCVVRDLLNSLTSHPYEYKDEDMPF